ncbi:MAG: hypothetical protein IIC74_12295 [Bacteroidetes bacterium]|nr:hypothetical protein [Bacteroidota bacterium]
MCWVGVDRAIKVAQHFGKEDLAAKWIGLRDEIKTTLIKKGWSEKRKSFAIHYGSDDLDASLLQMTYHEFLEFNDPRIIGTVKAIYKNLRKDYLVQRYKISDDLGKSTSSFTICSFWLVDALYSIGEEKKAREIYTDDVNFITSTKSYPSIIAIEFPEKLQKRIHKKKRISPKVTKMANKIGII